MQTDISGRVHNMDLAASKALLPLFEAIVNSFHAIEERGANLPPGRIEIVVERTTDIEDQQSAQDHELQGEITGFQVIDNGIGFTGPNFEAFQTADTTRKLAKGGKGVGRFLWLKAFYDVEIESVFLEDDGEGGLLPKRRHFKFVTDKNGLIEDTLEAAPPGTALRTVVSLRTYRSPYGQRAHKRLSTIGDRVIDHCLEFFLKPQCPEVVIRDARHQRVLNDVFRQEFATVAGQDEFKIGEYSFALTHLRLFAGEGEEHAVHFCANDREVFHENIEKLLPDLKHRLQHPDGRTFLWTTYVRGDLLNAKVDNERSSFRLPRDKEDRDLLDGPVTMAEIREAIAGKLKERLEPYLGPVRQQKIERINKLVYERVPNYRPVLKHRAQQVEKITVTASDEKIVSELSRIQFEWESEVKAIGERLLVGADVDREKYDRFLAEAGELAQADLAKYVLDRKYVLDTLSRHIGSKPEFGLEEKVHELVVPMRTTSDDIPFERMNLWLIDDRLTYHHYLASDLELKDLESVGVDSKRRADLLVFNGSLAFAEPGYPPSSVVIIEFKKPGRTEYKDKENPIEQVTRYISLIQSGKARDKNGQAVGVLPNTPFYCYIISDLSPRIVDWAKLAQLEWAPDRQGFFGYLKHSNAYIELSSYRKVLEDAKKRNRAFFDKLKLPQV